MTCPHKNVKIEIKKHMNLKKTRENNLKLIQGVKHMEEIDLRQIFKVLLEKKLFIIITTIFFLSLGFAYTKFFVTPKYQSSTTLILSKDTPNVSSYYTNSDEAGAIEQSDITMNNSLINTYRELIKSKTVVKQVIEEIGLTDISEDSLMNEIEVVAVQNTSILKITVSDKDPLIAEQIANVIPDFFKEEVKRIYKIQNVHTIDTAEVANEPYNISFLRNIAMFGAAGLVLSLMIVMLLFYLDNTIKTSDDIETYTGLNTLSLIPQVKTFVEN